MIGGAGFLLVQEPCLTWVLRDVVCDACSACRDLDLARDPNLQVHSS